MSRLNSHTFTFLDVETTGLSPWFGDRICEIAVVRCDGETIIETFDSLLNPERPISPGTAHVNGLKDADLRDAPKFVDVLEQVMALNDYLYLLAHCHLRDEERNFRLDRIENMNIEQ